LTSLTVDRLFIDHTTIEHTSRALLARQMPKSYIDDHDVS